MDPRKKSDDLKGPSLSFLTGQQVFSTDADTDPNHSTGGLRLSDTDSPHSTGLRLTTADLPHPSSLRLSPASSHPVSLPLSDADAMHLRIPDAEAAHAAAMRLTDDTDSLHSSALSLRLSESDIPHSSGLRLPLSTVDYGLSSLSNMYSMTSILSGTTCVDSRSTEVQPPKRDHYDMGLSRAQSLRFGVYNEDGRLPGISYMMSTQDSNMRAAGLDMTIPNLPAQPPTTLDGQTPISSLSTTHTFTSTSSTTQGLFSGRGPYGTNDSDSDPELGEAGNTHSNLTEAQERFASHLGRMDMKSIIEATKLAVAQQQLSHLPPGPLDMKQHGDAKELERQLIREASDVDALSSSLHPSDHLSTDHLHSDHLPGDHLSADDVTSLTAHHHDHTLTDMNALTDAHDLTTSDLSVQQHNDNSLTTDSPPSSPDKGKRGFDKRAVQSYWFHEFPWLLMDSTLNLFYCRFCMETSSDSVFAKGRHALKPKKDYFVKHEQTEVHREAAKKFLGLESQESQDIVASTSASSVNLDVMSLAWRFTSPSKLEEMHPTSTDFDPLPSNTVSTFQTLNPVPIPDPSAKPMIIDSTNAHVLNLVISPRTLAETRAQFEGWFDEFPWLVYDAQLNVFLCKACQQAGVPSLLTAAKAPDQLQRAPFETHRETDVHQEAMQALQQETGNDSGKDEDDDSETEGEAQTFRIRRIRPAWFLEFPWLELNQMDMCFYCKLCRLYKQPGVFSFGRPAGNPKKDYFVKHENTEGHKIAALQDAGISGEEAVRTVIAMQEMLNKEKLENEAMQEAEERIVVDESPVSEPTKSPEPAEMDLSKKAQPEQDPNRLPTLGGKTGLGRKIKLEWFMEYPWLELDENKNIFYCKLCRIYHPIGIYVSGKSAANPKRDDLRKHEATEGHKIAVNSHSRAGAEGEKRLENHSLDPSNAHLIDITTVSHIKQAQSKSSQISNNTPTITSTTTTNPFSHEGLSTTPSAFTVTSCIASSTTTSSMTSSSTTTSTLSSDDWATQFPWYTVESPSQTAYCTLCRAEGLSNALAQGVPVYIVMKKDCIVHEIIEEHQKAVEHAKIAAAEREQEEKAKKQKLENSLRSSATSEPPPKRPKTSPYVTKQSRLPDDAFADPKSPWKSSFWQLANQMRHLGILCDITLSVGTPADQRFYHAHKLLLVCSSELFKTYLRDNSLDTHYHFDNVSPVGLEGVLQYIYGQPVKGLTPEESLECCAAAEVLMMPKAKLLFQKSVVTKKPPEQLTAQVKNSTIEESKPPKEEVSPVVELNPIKNTPQSNNVVSDNKSNNEGTKLTSTSSGQDVDNDTKEEGFQTEQVMNKTVGQLAKKPSIIGRLRPKDRMKAYASLRSIQTRTRKARPRREATANPVPRRSTRETKTNGVKTAQEKPIEPAPPPPIKSEKKGKKRIKSEKSEPKVIVEKEPLLIEPQLIVPLDPEPEMMDEEDSVEDGIVEPEGEKESDKEEGVALDDDDDIGVVPDSNGGGDGERATPTVKHHIRNSEYAAERKKSMGDQLPTCEQCGKRFLRPAFLLRHTKLKHKGDTPPASHKCEDCGKAFSTRYDLKIHSRRHTGERPYLCNVCGKSFTRRETLIEHSYIHKPDSEKPHRCDVCGKGFYKIYDLQRHFVGIHSGARPFQCHLCGKSFPWARSLSDHLQSHQGADRVRPYKCEECDMNFRRKYDLERHKVKHAAQKPFVCEWCGHGFTQKGSMDKHKREFCHGRPGAPDQPPGKQAKNQSPKLGTVKVEPKKEESASNSGMDTATLATTGSTAVPFPTVLTLTTGPRAHNSDVFPTFTTSAHTADSDTSTSTALPNMYYSM